MQALALADGEKLDAVVLAELATVDVHGVAAMLLDELRLLEKAAVILVGEETDFHALFLFSGLQLGLAGDFARVGLAQLAEREERAGELLLLEREEEVALVLAQVASAPEQHAAVVAAFESRVVAGGDEIGAKLAG